MLLRKYPLSAMLVISDVVILLFKIIANEARPRAHGHLNAGEQALR